MEAVLDFSQPLDVSLLDRVVAAFYSGGPESARAQQVLTQLQQHPDAWTRVDRILETSQNPSTKYLALQILEGVIKYRWKVLPREQCDSIRQYIVGVVIRLSSDAATLQAQKLYLQKLDLTLVQIIKQEWPHRWQSFVPELLGASQSSEPLCENSMHILSLMSEEIFDFAGGQLTAAKAAELKQSFNHEFSLIYQLCELVLQNSQRPSLLTATLNTLLRFLNWIPVGYIFETHMIEILILKFFPAPQFKNVALRCLTEIAVLVFPDAEHIFPKFFNAFMEKLQTIIPPNLDLVTAYSSPSFNEHEFINLLALFLTGFFKNHRGSLENAENSQVCIMGHEYMVQLSQVPDEEVFKICLEYWHSLATELYSERPASAGQQQAPKRQMYAQVLSKVRYVLVSRFAKPEEVLLTEDDNGEVVREFVKDSEAMSLYKLMREVLVLLTNIDAVDTHNIMMERLSVQMDGTHWDRHDLSSLCWAIGSISGAVNEEAEKRFLVGVIRDLLSLVEQKRGKDNKAVIASNIMYIVGQYPRFLRSHWKFLKTVVNKLIEFMHEKHPGVQDMAVDTFLKIAQKCKRKFVCQSQGEPRPFVEELLDGLSVSLADLEPGQVQTFYHAMGYVVSAQADIGLRDALLVRLMDPPNRLWQEALARAAADAQSVYAPDTMRTLANVLKVNVAVAGSLGPGFSPQLGRIYVDMLQVYRFYSGEISRQVAAQGAGCTRLVGVRSMRAVKQEVLHLVETFVEHALDPQVVFTQFVPPLLEAVLPDYQQSVPDARDAQALSVITRVIDRVRGLMVPEISRVFAHVFMETLDMIKTNFVDYPDHRTQFFALIRAVNEHCFTAFCALQPQTFKLVMDSIVWAFKHTERNVSETGLTILSDLLRNVSVNASISDAFYQSYYRSILADILLVLTDTAHKSGFKMQATILKHLFAVVNTGTVNVPLFDQKEMAEAQAAGVQLTNQTWLLEHVVLLLSSAFPNLAPSAVRSYVTTLIASSELASFKATLRDFLVSLKEFSGDNAELFLEEQEAAKAQAADQERLRKAAIPGMLKPSEIQDDMADL
eukprot:m51a1_g2318 putative exportin-1 (1057) ;mRNA; f:487141-490960